MAERLSEAMERIRPRVDAVHAAREEALKTARTIIQRSAKTIKHLHRGQTEQADALLDELRQLLQEYYRILKPFPMIFYAPYVQVAVKEFVEAVLLRALLRGEPLPTHEELDVEPPAYLNGLCEAASELRRYILDSARKGDFERATRLVDEMEDIYDELVTFDYPDALLANLRQSVDALRAVLERTQNDLAVTATQRELIEELRLARGEEDR
ncbi:MAG: haloacid dehalogenase [Armatimonadetes bacterium]|nr:MAG: haloacid dehalogenase [Armatimonadota bacterium]